MPLISVLQFSKCAEFLNITCVDALGGWFLWGLPVAVAAVIVLVTVIFPVT